jgi:hypothetical protein
MILRSMLMLSVQIKLYMITSKIMRIQINSKIMISNKVSTKNKDKVVGKMSKLQNIHLLCRNNLNCRKTKKVEQIVR